MFEALMIVATFVVSFSLASYLSRRAFFSFVSVQGQRLSTLDGLRGFLALSVFICHFMVTYYWKQTGKWENTPEIYFVNLGKVGVALFFVLSGFLFLRKIIGAPGSVRWKSLYVSRIFRIYPLYLFSLLLICLIVFVMSGFHLVSAPVDIVKQLASWLIFRGGDINGYPGTNLINAWVDWTLKYEMAFYLSLPLVALLLIIHRLLFLLLIVPVTVYFYFNGVFFPGSIDSRYLIYFSVGGLVVYATENKVMRRIPWTNRWFSVVIVVATVFVVMYPHPLDSVSNLCLSLIFLIIAMGNTVFGVLVKESLIFAGEISYSIYLLHGVVLYFLFTVIEVAEIQQLTKMQYQLMMPIVGLMVVFISSLTYKCVEYPFIRAGYRLR